MLRAAGGNDARSLFFTSSKVVGDTETLVNLPNNVY